MATGGRGGSAAYGLAEPGRGPVGHEHSAGKEGGLDLSTRDVPGEGERRPVPAVGRDQGGRVRATAHREEPMTVADERPVRLRPQFAPPHVVAPRGGKVWSGCQCRPSSDRHQRAAPGESPIPSAIMPWSPTMSSPHSRRPAPGARRRGRQEGRRLRPVAAVGRPQRRRAGQAAPHPRSDRDVACRGALEVVEGEVGGNAFRGEMAQCDPSDEVAKRAARPLVATTSAVLSGGDERSKPVGLDSASTGRVVSWVQLRPSVDVQATMGGR